MTIGVPSDDAFGGLRRADLAPDPFEQFEHWFNQALGADLPDPTAMTLATATKEGVPSARIVLLKGFDRNGFVFYTNYESQKGCELAENPRAALVFYWPNLDRQIRIEGQVTEVSRDEAEHYFRSRPLGSRIGAWASKQSAVLSNREELERRIQEIMAQFPSDDVPLPPFWGGYRVAPNSIEFWQGRPSRLHDRFRYSRRADDRRADDQWVIERLWP